MELAHGAAFDLAQADGLCRVRLTDGQTIEGIAEVSNAEGARIRLSTGRRLLVPARRIQSLGGAGCSDDRSRALQVSPHRGRYLLQSSAIGRRGGYVSSKELFVATQADIGLTDRISVQLGSSLPALLAGVGNVGLGGRYSMPLRPTIHLAMGVQGFAFGHHLPSLGSAMLTSDHSWGNASLGLLVPFQTSTEEVEGWGPASTVATLSGFLALGRRFGIVTENWLLPADGEPDGLQPWVLNGVALRILGDVGSFELGMLRLNQEIAVPWVEIGIGW